jgi:hypothetical protein
MRFARLMCLLGTILWVAAMSAQTLERADLQGTVYDPKHAVVAGATVTLSSPSTGFQRTAKTSDSGEFHFVQLPPGQYNLKAEAAGFAATKLENLDLHVGASISLDVDLSIAGTTENVEVSASVAPVDTTTAGVGQVINSESISNMPLSGRDYRDLAQLTSSAQVVPGLRGGIRLGGQQSDYTGLAIDGGDAFNNYYGENFGSLETKNFTVPLDAVQEFQVVTNGFAPEFGHALGGLLNVITKSGTNDIHGTAHYYVRNSALTANDALGNAPNVDWQHQFGGSFGFPIVKDKQFLFLATDVQREHGPLITKFNQDVSAVPMLPAPYNFTLASLEGSHTQFTDLVSVLGHYDWQINPTNHFSLRTFFSRNNTDGFTGGQGQNETPDAFDNTEHYQNQGPSAVFGLNTVFGSNKVNDLKLLIQYETRKRHSNGLGLPQVFIGDTGSFGQRFYLPANDDNGKLQVQDNFDYVFRKHDMKFGGEVNSFLDNKDTFVGWGAGEYEYATLADFFTPGKPLGWNPFEFIQGFALNNANINKANTLKPNYQTDIGLFWQDKWQVSSRFTLTYGLRWDGTRNPQPQSAIPGDQGKGQDVYIGVGPIGPGGSHLAPVPQGVPNDYEQWGPRVGFSYNVGSQQHPTVLRGAWGLYYANTPLIFFPTIGGSLVGTVFGVPGFFPPQAVFPNIVTPNSLPIGVNQLCTSFIGCQAINYVDPSFKNPRVNNYTLGVQQSLTGGWVFDATGVYMHSTRLRTGGFSTTQWARNVVVDHYDQFGRAILVPFSGVNPTIQPVGFGTSELGSFSRGSYVAFTAGIRKSISRYQFFANYTLAKNLDNASTERDSESFFGPSDPFDINLDYGRNSLDIRHQFKAGIVALLPWGVTLSDQIIAHSGLPYPAYDAHDANNDSVINQFSNNDHPTVTPASGSAYLLPRFPASQPDYFETDFRIGKAFKLKEHEMLEISADMFNLTNHGNLFSDPDTNAIVPDQLTGRPQPGDTFGGTLPAYRKPTQISPGSLPFAAQFGARFSF